MSEMQIKLKVEEINNEIERCKNAAQAVYIEIRKLAAEEAQLQQAVAAAAANRNIASASNAPQQHGTQIQQNNPQAGPSVQHSGQSALVNGQMFAEAQAQIHNMPPQQGPGGLGQPVQRHVPTPVQMLPGAPVMQTSPQMGSTQFLAQVPGNPAQQRPGLQSGKVEIPALPQPQFQHLFQRHREKNGLMVDENMLHVDGRSFSLHTLHTCVMQAGGYTNVCKFDQWQLIGAKLGFVQFPESDKEPARAGPGVATQLQHVYRTYLLNFDAAYISSYLQKIQAFRAAQNRPATNGVGPSSHPTLAGLSSLLGVSDPKQIAALVRMSALSTPVLRSRNVPEHFVNIVSANRPVLRATLQSQVGFHEGVMQGLTANGSMQTQPQPPFLNGQPQNPQNPQNAQMAQNVMATSPHPTQPGIANSGRQFVSMAHNGAMPPQNAPRDQITKPEVPVNAGRMPTDAELQQGRTYVNQLRLEYVTRIKSMQPQQVSDEQRLEYDKLLEESMGYAKLVEQNLPLFACAFNEGIVRRITAATTTVFYQNQLIVSSQPKRFIVTLENLQQILHTMRMAAQNIPYNGPRDAEGAVHGYMHAVPAP
ncbi:hypothetical protein WOLCODRAFT_168132 [Wolfiporia cocos MD-104 SS10]|uniref:ARID domain-containing protein n=1 Tax=Wolfiporia cocos (strain MD-104) TaxID=742152 RepID=A0A2H3JNN0_WOLCO|nr:hypothetical protein WOLCODRAFT_168132 [Wolfiporia cocos MD-104 SS10]